MSSDIHFISQHLLSPDILQIIVFVFLSFCSSFPSSLVSSVPFSLRC